MCGRTVTCTAGRDGSERRHSVSHLAGTAEPQRWPSAPAATCGSSLVPGAASSPALPLLVRAVACKHWYPASSKGRLLVIVPRIWFKEEQLLTFPLSCFLSQGTDSQTVPKDALWQGSSRTLPLSDKGTEAKQATATPGKGCSLAIHCHQAEPACACRFLPWHPLLHLMAAAKPQSVSRQQVLQRKAGVAPWGWLSALGCDSM